MTDDRRRVFRRLHEGGCFVMPNPWDAGSAKLLQAMGFESVASTSAGFAWATGRPDYGVERDAVLAHLRLLTAATGLPVNADYENGFADAPEDVAHNVRLALDTGIAGLSVEDYPGRPEAPLYDLPLAAARIAAAREAMAAVDPAAILTARYEGLIRGREDMGEAVERIAAYAEAGADCLYAPGVRGEEAVAAIVKAAGGKPVNVLLGVSGLTVTQLADLGVRRISIGGALARAAWGGFVTAARSLQTGGDMSAPLSIDPFVNLDAAFDG